MRSVRHRRGGRWLSYVVVSSRRFLSSCRIEHGGEMRLVLYLGSTTTSGVCDVLAGGQDTLDSGKGPAHATTPSLRSVAMMEET